MGGRREREGEGERGRRREKRENTNTKNHFLLRKDDLLGDQWALVPSARAALPPYFHDTGSQLKVFLQTSCLTIYLKSSLRIIYHLSHY